MLVAITLLATCSFIALEKPMCHQKQIYKTVTQTEEEANRKRDTIM